MLRAYRPEKGNLDEVLRPPHGGGLHQVLPKNSGPTKTQHLGGYNDKQGRWESQLLLVKDLDGADYVYSVNITGASVCQYGNKHMLLQVERSRIKAELPSLPFEEDSSADQRGHQVAQRNHRDLGRNRCDGEWLPAVPKELVDEREEDASQAPQNPRAKREGWEGRIICCLHRECHLLDR